MSWQSWETEQKNKIIEMKTRDAKCWNYTAEKEMNDVKDGFQKMHTGCKEIKVISEMIWMEQRKWEANIWKTDTLKEKREEKW